MPEGWNDLELAKYRQEWWKILATTVASTLTPIAIAVLTYFIATTLNEQQSFLRKGEQVLEEKRRIYSQLGRHINIMYVYASDVGDFRKYTPVDIIENKREADRIFVMYGPFWSCETHNNYKILMTAMFITYRGEGKDARIRALVREKTFSPIWKPEWKDALTDEQDPALQDKYNDFLRAILRDLVEAALPNSGCS